MIQISTSVIPKSLTLDRRLRGSAPGTLGRTRPQPTCLHPKSSEKICSCMSQKFYVCIYRRIRSYQDGRLFKTRSVSSFVDCQHPPRPPARRSGRSKQSEARSSTCRHHERHGTLSLTRSVHSHLSAIGCCLPVAALLPARAATARDLEGIQSSRACMPRVSSR